ncbi:MAG: hypothetical protein ACR2JF_14980 [Iamia sp.]
MVGSIAPEVLAVASNPSGEPISAVVMTVRIGDHEVTETYDVVPSPGEMSVTSSHGADQPLTGWLEFTDAGQVRWRKASDGTLTEVVVSETSAGSS